jgi:hypothetical protein
MAVTALKVKNYNLGQTDGKLYEIIHDGSTTTVNILPGVEFNTPWGGHTKWTVSSGTFTLTFVAGTNATKSYVMFLKS